MLAKELIDRIERLGLLDQEIIEALREQLEQGGTRVTPEAVAKLLVDNGQLTHFQATKLIGELRSGEYQEDDAAPVEVVDDLSIVSEDVAEIVEEVEEVVEVAEAEPVAQVYEAVEAVPAEPVVAEAMPVAEAVPVGVAEAMTMEDEGGAAPARPVNRTVKKPDPEKSIWDSFKIYGYLGIIVLLILIGGGIWWVLSRESADEFIARADDFYNNQNYSGAQETYLSFLDTFGQNHEFSSRARTRVAMTNLYRASEFRNDPGRALEIEAEQLPLLEKENEDGLNLERGDLAQVIVDIAKNIAEAAVDEKETEKKRDLLKKLDTQIKYTENPIYVTSSAKATLAAQFEQVFEARKRVERDIDRNVSLDKAVKEMTSALKDKLTKKAYDVRARLLREFPELYDNERLIELILEASDIQYSLVKPSANLPETVKDPSDADEVPSVVLTTLTGDPAPGLRGETLFLRASGSVLALDGETGNLKWRRFVGYSKDLPPVRIGGGDGVILSDSASKQVLRCAPEDGKVGWLAKIDENFSTPVSYRDEVFVACESGRLIKFNAEAGEADWVTALPQPLEIGPGVMSTQGVDRAYITGNHSNLYVMDTRDGSCIESFYIGHAEGTVSVPPIALMGHLFVIENEGTDHVNVHVLKYDEKGENVEKAQDVFRLDGNVTVSPIVSGKRLIVLTDHGEVKAYEVELLAEGQDKVSEAASGPPFYDNPASTRMAVQGNQMWIAGTSIGRYELQYNTANVRRQWDKHNGDLFIGQPYAGEDTLVFARVLRQSKTIRVTAADPNTGDFIWRTDVGVPVSMLKPYEDGVHAVTTQAALFELNKDDFGSLGSTQPAENPGDASIVIQFEDPVAIDEKRSLMVNTVSLDKILLYDPDRPRQLLQQITLNLPGAEFGGKAIVADDGLCLPLASGRVVRMDYRIGQMNASPFQPASDPSGTVKWTQPVIVPADAGQVVIADNRKKIYRLRIGDQVRDLASRDLEFQFLGPAAGVGNTMIATAHGPAADFLLGHDLVSLQESFRKLLNGRVKWGPVVAGDICLLQTDDDILRGIKEDGSQRFEIPVPTGVPVGKPLLFDGKIVLAGGAGWVVALDAATGNLLGKTDIKQPISATPLNYNGALLIPGSEGVVYMIDVPNQP